MKRQSKNQPSAPPPRAQWPQSPSQTEAGELVTNLVMTTFQLNGLFLEVAQKLAARGGLTAAWWQVLGGALDQPRSVSDISRRMGVTRQSVQRVADLLVARGLAEYRPNPAHRKAKLLACTETGHWAIRQISLVQRPWAHRVGTAVDLDELRQASSILQRLIAVLEADG